jgi:hypothetical protein
MRNLNPDFNAFSVFGMFFKAKLDLEQMKQ